MAVVFLVLLKFLTKAILEYFKQASNYLVETGSAFSLSVFLLPQIKPVEPAAQDHLLKA